MKTAIFIMSCDKTRDVLEHFIKGFNLYWKDNSLKIYLGSNDLPQPNDFKNSILLSVPNSNWKNETIDQLVLLQKLDPDLTHVLVILDDFILSNNVDNLRLNNILSSGQFDKIKYLRLKRLEEGIFKKIVQLFLIDKKYTVDKVFKIRKNHPYYSSLQIAIWDINYLKSCIINTDNIWNFELQNLNNEIHYSILSNIFSYKHIVEKGKWEPYAKKYCNKYIKYFNPNKRYFQSNDSLSIFKNWIVRIKFLFFWLFFIN